MKVSTFLTIKAFVSIIFGVLFVLVPAGAMAIFDVSLDAVGVFMVRYYGVGMLGIGLICAFYRNRDRNTLADIFLALFIADTIGFIIALTGQLSGLVNLLHWVPVLFWLFFAAGMGYFRFTKDVSSSAST